jgi:hypothetical protein
MLLVARQLDRKPDRKLGVSAELSENVSEK